MPPGQPVGTSALFHLQQQVLKVTNVPDTGTYESPPEGLGFILLVILFQEIKSFLYTKGKGEGKETYLSQSIVPKWGEDASHVLSVPGW